MYKKISLLGLGFGIAVIEALPIFLVTIILVLQGESGPAFLSKIFPFYEISWAGAFIGLVEGFIDGFVGGVILAWVYNFVTARSEIAGTAHQK